MAEPQTLGDPKPILLELARSLAIKNHLVDETGTVWCWECDQEPALVPSNHCARCLAESHRRTGRLAPLCVNREQTAADRAACLALNPKQIRTPRVPRVGTFATRSLPPEPEVWERD